MTPRIVRTIARADSRTINALGDFGVATVHEAQGRNGLMRAYMRPIYPSARVAGSAITVLCPPGDNLTIHAAIEVCREGDVLVVAIASASDHSDACGMFGDLLATSCRSHGVRALVIDAGVRDIAELTQMEFPAWSKAISAQGTVKAAVGSVNLPIVCAGVEVNPGDVIVGDADGVVVVKRNSAAEVAKAAQQRREKEELARRRLGSGELGLDIYGLRAKLTELGVEYVDKVDED
jgi:4-hydroxy-4-methyl-2-oxoglutarate aldolase